MAEAVSPEEAKALGLAHQQERVSEEEARAIGIQPPPQAAPEPSFWEKAAESLNGKPVDYALRLNPATMGSKELLDWATKPKEQVSRLRSAVSGMTLGAAPHMIASMEQATGLGSGDVKPLQAEYHQAVAEYPVENFAGGAAMPFPGSSLKGAAGVATRIGVGGAMGAVSGAMDTPGPLALDQPHLRDAGEGFATGAAFTAGGEGVRAGLGKLKDVLKRRGELLAWKAAQGTPDISDIARKMGYQNESDIREAGREFLDQGLIPVGGRPADIAARARKLQDQAGTSATSILQRAETSKRPFDALEALDSAEKSMRGKGLSPAAEDAAGPAKKFLDQVARQDAVAPGSYLGARKLKSDAYRSINWDTEAPLSAELHRKATLGYRDSIADQVGKASGLTDQLAMEKANRLFGVGADAEALADRAARRQAGHTLGFGGLMARMGVGALSGAGAGTMSGHPGAGGGAGAAAALLEYLTKNRQASALARAADAGGKIAGVAGRANVPALAASAGRELTDDERQALASYLAGLAK